jgi:hypothetical protein
MSNSNNSSMGSGGGISNPGSGIGIDNNELRKLLLSKVDKTELE